VRLGAAQVGEIAALPSAASRKRRRPARWSPRSIGSPPNRCAPATGPRTRRCARGPTRCGLISFECTRSRSSAHTGSTRASVRSRAQSRPSRRASLSVAGAAVAVGGGTWWPSSTVACRCYAAAPVLAPNPTRPGKRRCAYFSPLQVEAQEEHALGFQHPRAVQLGRCTQVGALHDGRSVPGEQAWRQREEQLVDHAPRPAGRPGSSGRPRTALRRAPWSARSRSSAVGHRQHLGGQPRDLELRRHLGRLGGPPTCRRRSSSSGPRTAGWRRAASCCV